MPRLPAAFRRGIVLLAACLVLLPACQPRDGAAGQPIGVAKTARIEAATRPVDAANLLRDRFRRERSHHTGLHDPLDDSLHELPSEEPGTDDVYASRERLERLLSALDELSPRCRQVFLLQRYEGMTYTAIARQLQVSVSAVEKHMMRALLHLQARLAEP